MPSAERRVSVVIPTHNRRAMLQRTLTSVLGQRGVSVDCIVVDDGSSDDTPDFLRSLDEPRVQVLRHEQPVRIANARNAGLSVASAPWVAFVDDDDLWAPERLSSQLDAINRTGAAWACSATVLVDERLEILGFHATPPEGDVSAELLKHNIVPGGGSAVLARTLLVRRLGGFDPQMPPAEDWDLWIRLSLTSRLACVQQPDVAYMIHTSASTDVRRMQGGMGQVYDKHQQTREARGAEPDDSWFWSAVLTRHLMSRNRRGAIAAKLQIARRVSGVKRLRAAAGAVPAGLGAWV